MRILVLGAGFGGLELTTLLAEALGEEVEIVLIDRSPGFVFGFSKLDVMFGRTTAEHVVHRYADIVKPGVRFVQTPVLAIDAMAREVRTGAGTFAADILVVALGADLHPEATPGLVEHGHEYYSVEGAFAARDVLARFPGGRVVIGLAGTPFKCPPAPSETALMLHDLLSAGGVRAASEITLIMPLGAPIPPSPEASAALLRAFAERDIRWQPNLLVRSLDDGVARLSDGSTIDFDLFLGVPVHRAPAVVLESGLAVDGWIPVDPGTLQTAHPGVYAVGDVTSIGTPKAGVFAEGQARVVAAQIIATVQGRDEPTGYDGRGICFLEFGQDQVAKVEVTFHAGEQPHGGLDGPTALLAADKAEFGSSRARRWFGHQWATQG